MSDRAATARPAAISGRTALAWAKVVPVALKLVSLAVVAIGLTLIAVGIGPQSTNLRLVQSVSGAAIALAGALFFLGVGVDVARTILAGIATGTFAIAVASARSRPVTDADLLLPMLLGLSLIGVEACGHAARLLRARANRAEHDGLHHPIDRLEGDRDGERRDGTPRIVSTGPHDEARG